ncbi:MAG: EMC3/TMCO1 family protein [Candidatus Caldarchaeum sp.]|nr:EMC3/TMCO1 family protein [Candidatus Caldarchaeum sp.]
MFLEMVIISGMAAGMSAATSALRKVVFKKEDLAKMAEIQAFNRELMTATRKKDQKTIQKLQKKREYIQKLNAEVSKKNLITMFASLMLFFTVYPVLAAYFGDSVVGFTPKGFEIPFISDGGELRFYGWFILSFFGVGSPISKLLGISFTGMGGEVGKERPQDKKQDKEKS